MHYFPAFQRLFSSLIRANFLSSHMSHCYRRMKWKKDNKLPNTKNVRRKTNPAGVTTTASGAATTNNGKSTSKGGRGSKAQNSAVAAAQQQGNNNDKRKNNTR